MLKRNPELAREQRQSLLANEMYSSSSSGIRASSEQKLDRGDHLLAISATQFQRGDILLLLAPSKGATPGQQLLNYFQAFHQQESSSYQLSQVAIYIDFELKAGKFIPLIAEVTIKGFRITKLKENQPVLVFRPSCETLGRIMAEKARAICNNLKDSYQSCCPSLKGFFAGTNSNYDDDEDAVLNRILNSKDSVQFLLEIIHESIQFSDPKKFEPCGSNMHSINNLKELEAALYGNNHYQMYLYLGLSEHLGNPYLLVKNEVVNQITRLREQKSPKGKLKYEDALAEYNESVDALAEDDEMDDLSKAIQLSVWMKEVFKINTGRNIRTPDSLMGLQAAMRGLSIFQSVVNRYSDNEVQMQARSTLIPR